MKAVRRRSRQVQVLDEWLVAGSARRRLRRSSPVGVAIGRNQRPAAGRHLISYVLPGPHAQPVVPLGRSIRPNLCPLRRGRSAAGGGGEPQSVLPLCSDAQEHHIHDVALPQAGYAVQQADFVIEKHDKHERALSAVNRVRDSCRTVDVAHERHFTTRLRNGDALAKRSRRSDWSAESSPQRRKARQALPAGILAASLCW